MPDPFQEVIEKDPRYTVEAYVFVHEALPVAQQLFKRERHVSGKELLEGIKVLAQERFGLMAKQVLNSWGVKKTDDFGNIVFNLGETGTQYETRPEIPVTQYRIPAVSPRPALD